MVSRVLSKNPLLISLPLGILLSIGIFWNLLIAKPGAYLWADNFDGKLLYWIINWGYHVLFEQYSPTEFFHANSFYPNQYTLAYSDSLLSAQLFFAPLRLLGFSPLHALYGTLALVVVSGVALTFFALNRLQLFSISESIIITCCAHFSLSTTQFLYHYQMFGAHYAPAVLLFLYLFLRTWKLSYLTLLCSIFAFACCFSMYMAPILFSVSVLLTLAYLLPLTFVVGPMQILKNIRPSHIITAASIAIILYFIQFRPYFLIADAFPKQEFTETANYSANIRSLVSEYSTNSFWYASSASYINGDWEHAYFPGWILFSLLCSGLVISAYHLVSILGDRCRILQHSTIHSKNSRSKEFSLFLCFSAVTFVLTFFLSLGPFYKAVPSIKFPFYYLSAYLPGLESIRAPGRFGMIFGLSFGVFTVASLRFLQGLLCAASKAPVSARNWRTIGLALFPYLVLFLILLESFPTFKVHPFTSRDAVYEMVGAAIEPDTPLLELPVAGEDHYKTIILAVDQLIGSTRHWGRLMTGYGAKWSPEYHQLLSLDFQIQAGTLPVEEALAFAKSYQISYFLVHLDLYSDEIQEQWRGLLNKSPQLQLAEDLLVNTVPEWMELTPIPRSKHHRIDMKTWEDNSVFFRVRYTNP